MSQFSLDFTHVHSQSYIRLFENGIKIPESINDPFPSLLACSDCTFPYCRGEKAAPVLCLIFHCKDDQRNVKYCKINLF